MLNLDTFIADVESALGWPYVSPGSNDSRGIDCSGLFVYAFKKQGEKIYHGSNTIWRQYLSRKGKIKSEKDLERGMAVFKWNSNTPSRFNDNEGDFQHIGVVCSVNPLRIIHASSVKGKVVEDSKTGNWKYWGWLKQIKPPGESDGDTKEGEKMTTPYTAAVTADKVNVRRGPSVSDPRITQVHTGDTVTVLSESNGWAYCSTPSSSGWIKMDYLRAIEEVPPADDTVPEAGTSRWGVFIPCDSQEEAENLSRIFTVAVVKQMEVYD